MIYTIEFQELAEIDWFIVDKIGQVAMMRSTGCLVPFSVAQSRENNDLLFDYFQKIKNPITESVKNYELNWSLPSSNGYDPFSEYSFYSDRGLYAYMSKRDYDLECFEYQFITAPKEPLNISELPSEISEILKLTFYDGLFSETKLFVLNPETT